MKLVRDILTVGDQPVYHASADYCLYCFYTTARGNATMPMLTTQVKVMPYTLRMTKTKPCDLTSHGLGICAVAHHTFFQMFNYTRGYFQCSIATGFEVHLFRSFGRLMIRLSPRRLDVVGLINCFYAYSFLLIHNQYGVVAS